MWVDVDRPADQGVMKTGFRAARVGRQARWTRRSCSGNHKLQPLRNILSRENFLASRELIMYSGTLDRVAAYTTKIRQHGHTLAATYEFLLPRYEAKHARAQAKPYHTEAHLKRSTEPRVFTMESSACGIITW